MSFLSVASLRRIIISRALSIMKTIIFFLFLALSIPVWADDAETQIHQLEKQLARIQQESESTYQQFLMTQELRRNAIEAPLPIEIPPNPPDQSIPIPDYDELIKEKEEKQDHIKDYTDDLNRLSARHKELENEKQEIIGQINLLKQEPKE